MDQTLHRSYLFIGFLIEAASIVAEKMLRLPLYINMFREEGASVFLVHRLGRALGRRSPAHAEFYLRFLASSCGEGSLACYELGHLLSDQGRFEEAWQSFERGLKSNRNDCCIPEGTSVRILRMMSERNAIKEYIEFAKRILPFAHDRQLFSVMLGGIFTRLGSAEYLECRQEVMTSLERQYRHKPLLDEFEVVDLSPSDTGFCGKSLLPSAPFSFYEPRVFESTEDRPLRTVQAPPCFVAEVRKASVIGSFAVLQDHKLLNYESAAHPQGSLVAGTWEYVWGYRKEDNKALVGYPFVREAPLNEAILLSGRCSRNYFHWLIEYIPKAWAIEQLGLDKSIPVIIDSRLYSQQREALEIFLKGRPVFEFDHQTMLNVDRLWIPSIPTHMPDDFVDPYWMNSAVSSVHMRFLQEKVIPLVDQLPPMVRPMPKIYLSRREYGGRKLTNEKRLEAVFVQNGFAVVYPEQMSFLQQAQLFRQAKAIAGPGGAAFTNVLFCRPKTKILAFTSEKNRGFCMHSILADFAGADFTYVTGPNRFGPECFLVDAEYAHSEYSIPEDKVKRALRALLDEDQVS